MTLAPYSYAEGSGTTAGGPASHAEGNGTVTNNFAEHAEGSHNVSNKNSDTFGGAENTISSIGIGTSLADKKNAWEVMQNGDAYLIGVGQYDGTNPDDATSLQTTINAKQNSLTAGTNITIDANNVISAAGGDNVFEVTSDTLSADLKNAWDDGKICYLHYTFGMTNYIYICTRRDFANFTFNSVVNLTSLSKITVSTSGTVVSISGASSQMLVNEDYKASSRRLGLVKPDGTTITVDSSGVISARESYSTTEQVVGTWIDGKPIYRKTIDTGNLLNAATKTVAHGVQNIGKIISAVGFAIDNGGSSIALPLVSGTPQYAIAVWADSTNVMVSTYYDRSAYSGYITLEYTKTTD